MSLYDQAMALHQSDRTFGKIYDSNGNAYEGVIEHIGGTQAFKLIALVNNRVARIKLTHDHAPKCFMVGGSEKQALVEQIESSRSKRCIS